MVPVLAGREGLDRTAAPEGGEDLVGPGNDVLADASHAGADKAGGGFCSALLQPEEWDGIISVSGGNVDGHLESLDSFLAVHKESEGEHLEKVRGADYLAPDGGQLSQRRRQGGDPRRRGGSLPKLIDENKRPGGAPAKDGRHLVKSC